MIIGKIVKLLSVLYSYLPSLSLDNRILDVKTNVPVAFIFEFPFFYRKTIAHWKKIKGTLPSSNLLEVAQFPTNVLWDFLLIWTALSSWKVSDL